MKDLFRSEWRRFSRYSMIVALFHLLAVFLISRVSDVTELPSQDQAAMLAVYMLLGLALSIVQVGSYRQTSRWLWLIHRPLPPGSIFAAVALAALAHLSIAILAPLVVFLLATDIVTTQVVDIRHYMSLLHAISFTMMAWLAGAHASTSRSKAAVAVIVAPLILALHLASVWWLLIPVLVCVAWLAFITRHGFRANRNAPVERNTVLVLTALPLQLAFFFLVFQLSKTGLALGDLISRAGPGRTVLASDPNVDIEAIVRNMKVNLFTKGLEKSSDPHAPEWRQQLPLLQHGGVSPDISRFPVRNQIGNANTQWWDEKRNTKWTFSHDRMMFRGRDGTTREHRGWWGARGFDSAERFGNVPLQPLSRNVLYAVDNESQRQYELVRLPHGEWFLGKPARALDRMLVLTNKRLLSYRESADELLRFSPPQLDWQLRLADVRSRPAAVDIVELLDGWLVSIFYSDASEFGGFKSLANQWQQVVHIDANGQASVVGERRNIRDLYLSTSGSALVPLSSWWISPPMYALAHLPDVLDTGLTQPPRFEILPEAAVFQVLAIAMIIISVAAGFYWLRRAKVSRSRRRFWLASCAVIGVPALLSMMCLEPRRSACV